MLRSSCRIQIALVPEGTCNCTNALQELWHKMLHVPSKDIVVQIHASQRKNEHTLIQRMLLSIDSLEHDVS
jgi:hypothetical protein